MLVLIVGITGNLGLKITGALHARGHKVRGAARNPKNIPEAQFKSLEGFYQLSAWYDADSLRKALKGVDAVICAYTPTPSLALEGELLLVRLMEEEGIKRFVPSAWNLDWTQVSWGQAPYYDTFLALKRQIELSSSVEPMWIFTGIFSEVFFSVPNHGGFAPANNGVWDPDSHTAVVWGTGNEKWQICTEENASEFTAELVTDTTKGAGVYRFCSYEKSTLEMAQAYKQARGVAIKIVNAGSIEDLRVTAYKAVEEKGLRNFWGWMGYFYQLYQLNGTFQMMELNNDLYPSIEPTSLEEFLKNHPEI